MRVVHRHNEVCLLEFAERHLSSTMGESNPVPRRNFAHTGIGVLTEMFCRGAYAVDIKLDSDATLIQLATQYRLGKWTPAHVSRTDE